MIERRINLKGVGNVRQLGGMISNHKMIRDNTLIRAAHLHRITDEDIDILKDRFNLSKVIDLRRKQEVEEKPDRVGNVFEYENIPIFEEIVAGVSHDKKSEEAVQYTSQDLQMLYHYLVLDQECQSNFSKALKTIINHDYDKGSVLWHCSEGKDRCGLVSSFVLFMLGFSYEQVLEDYLITNETNLPKVQRYYDMYIGMGRNDQEARAVAELYMAKKEYFDEAYDTIIENYKSIDNYLTNALNITEDEINLFTKKVLI